MAALGNPALPAGAAASMRGPQQKMAEGVSLGSIEGWQARIRVKQEQHPYGEETVQCCPRGLCFWRSHRYAPRGRLDFLCGS